MMKKIVNKIIIILLLLIFVLITKTYAIEPTEREDGWTMYKITIRNGYYIYLLPYFTVESVWESELNSEQVKGYSVRLSNYSYSENEPFKFTIGFVNNINHWPYIKYDDTNDDDDEFEDIEFGNGVLGWKETDNIWNTIHEKAYTTQIESSAFFPDDCGDTSYYLYLRPSSTSTSQVGLNIPIIFKDIPGKWTFVADSFWDEIDADQCEKIDLNNSVRENFWNDNNMKGRLEEYLNSQGYPEDDITFVQSGSFEQVNEDYSRGKKKTVIYKAVDPNDGSTDTYTFTIWWNDTWCNLHRTYHEGQRATATFVARSGEPTISTDDGGIDAEAGSSSPDLGNHVGENITILYSVRFNSIESQRDPVIFTDVLTHIENYIPRDEVSDGRVEGKVSIILTIITNIGMVLAVLMVAIIGVKYMLGSVEEKAEYKKDMIPYLVGACLLFGITVIVKVLQQIGQSINNI